MIKTRFAPSPTGSMHIGNLRTAFYAYALAKHSSGKFILRIENTDKKREVKGGIESIKKTLSIFDIKWDEYFVQSDRLEFYKKAAEKLVKDGHAYKDDGAIRIKIPKNEKISFFDFVLNKEVVWETNNLKDLVILKSDGFPTYHLASVVDDHEMQITHVLRGHDWLPSTPIHLLIYKYLGYTLPAIGHLTDILDPEGGKLSKRKGSTSVEGLLNDGYLTEAILNFVILLGWAPKDNRELFTLPEFVKAFDPKGLQINNPVFNQKKLDWFNSQYIQKLPDESLTNKLLPFVAKGLDKKTLEKVTPLIKTRIKKLSEITSLTEFFVKPPKVDKNLFGKNYQKHIQIAVPALETIESFNNEIMNKILIEEIKNNNFKVADFFMDLRIAITGQKITPPINESMVILGKEETIKRLKKCLPKNKS